MRFEDYVNAVENTNLNNDNHITQEQDNLSAILNSVSLSASDTWEELEAEYSDTISILEGKYSTLQFMKNTAEIQQALNELPEIERQRATFEWFAQLAQQREQAQLDAMNAPKEEEVPVAQQLFDWIDQAKKDIDESLNEIGCSTKQIYEDRANNLTGHLQERIDNIHDINVDSSYMNDMPTDAMTAEDWAARAQMGAAYNWKKTGDIFAEGAHAVVGATGDMVGVVMDTVGEVVGGVLGETIGFANKDTGNVVKSSFDAVTHSVTEGISGLANVDSLEELEQVGQNIVGGYEETADVLHGIQQKNQDEFQERVESQKELMTEQKNQFMDIIDSHRPENLPGYEFLSAKAETAIGQEVIQNNLDMRVSLLEISDVAKALSDMRKHGVSETTIGEIRDTFAATATFNDPTTAHSTRTQMIDAMNTFNSNMESSAVEDYQNLPDNSNSHTLKTQLDEIYNTGLKQDLISGKDISAKTAEVVGENLDLYHEAQITEVNNLINMQDNTPVGNLSYEQQCNQLQAALDNYDKVAKNGDIIELGGTYGLDAIQVGEQKATLNGQEYSQNVYSVDGGKTFMSKNELMQRLQEEQFKDNLMQFSDVYQPPEYHGTKIFGRETMIVDTFNSLIGPQHYNMDIDAKGDTPFQLTIREHGGFTVINGRSNEELTTPTPEDVLQSLKNTVTENIMEHSYATSTRAVTHAANKATIEVINECNTHLNEQLQATVPDRTDNLFTDIIKGLETKTAENQKEAMTDLAKTTKNTASR